jgi:hypothetical protein
MLKIMISNVLTFLRKKHGSVRLIGAAGGAITAMALFAAANDSLLRWFSDLFF